MGYSSTMELNAKLKHRADTALLKDALQRIGWDYFDIEDDYLVTSDWYGKWGETEDLARLLSAFVEKGTLEFIGEDGYRWGYEFTGKNELYELCYTVVRGKKLL